MSYSYGLILKVSHSPYFSILSSLTNLLSKVPNWEFRISEFEISNFCSIIVIFLCSLRKSSAIITALETAKCVELRDLEYKEIFRLMQSIVQNIKEGVSFDVVYSRAVMMADDLRREHKNKQL